MVIWVVEISRGGYKIRKILPENQHTTRRLLNFENWCSGELSKFGHHFINKVILKMMVSKNVNNEKCAPKFVFSNEKNEKDSNDF